MGGFWLFIPYLALCLAIGWSALKKNRSSMVWFAAALILSPLVGVLLIFLPDQPPAAEPPPGI